MARSDGLMTRKQALELAEQIQREDPRITANVRGPWTGSGGHYDLTCVDTRTGISFVVNTPEQWEERKRAADWPAVEGERTMDMETIHENEERQAEIQASIDDGEADVQVAHDDGLLAMTTVHWRELEVHDADGFVGHLGELVDDAPANLDACELNEDGSVSEWQGHFVAAPGEAPDWDTPRGEVDWSGLAAALKAARGAEDN